MTKLAISIILKISLIAWITAASVCFGVWLFADDNLVYLIIGAVGFGSTIGIGAMLIDNWLSAKGKAEIEEALSEEEK